MEMEIRLEIIEEMQGGQKEKGKGGEEEEGKGGGGGGGGGAAMFKKYAKNTQEHGRSKDVEHEEDGALKPQKTNKSGWSKSMLDLKKTQKEEALKAEKEKGGRNGSTLATEVEKVNMETSSHEEASWTEAEWWTRSERSWRSTAEEVFVAVANLNGDSDVITKDELMTAQGGDDKAFEDMEISENGEVTIEEFMKYLAKNVDKKEDRNAGGGVKWVKHLCHTLFANIKLVTGVGQKEEEKEEKGGGEEEEEKGGGGAAMFKKYAKTTQEHGRSKDVEHEEDGALKPTGRSRRSSFAEEGKAEELT